MGWVGNDDGRKGAPPAACLGGVAEVGVVVLGGGVGEARLDGGRRRREGADGGEGGVALGAGGELDGGSGVAVGAVGVAEHAGVSDEDLGALLEDGEERLQGVGAEVVDEALPGLVAFGARDDGQVALGGGGDVFSEGLDLGGALFGILEVPVAVWDDVDHLKAFLKEAVELLAWIGLPGEGAVEPGGGREGAAFADHGDDLVDGREGVRGGLHIAEPALLHEFAAEPLVHLVGVLRGEFGGVGMEAFRPEVGGGGVGFPLAEGQVVVGADDVALGGVAVGGDGEDVAVVVEMGCGEGAVDACDEGAVAAVGLLEHGREGAFGLGAGGGAVHEARAHEIEYPWFAWGVDFGVGVLGEEDAAFEGDGGAQAEEVACGEELGHALEDVEVAEGGGIEAEALHFVGDAARRPAFPVVGEERVDVHVHRGDFGGEVGGCGERGERVGALPGVEGGEALEQGRGFHSVGDGVGEMRILC